MARQEQIWIEGERGVFDRFSALEISTDIFGEASATVQVADDRAWASLKAVLYPGKPFTVRFNGLVQFTGRVEGTELPTTCEDGTTIQVTLRTRLADTRVGSADPKVTTSNASIRDFILRLYAQHGFTASDFLFTPDADRDLVTGRRPGRQPPVDLEPLTADKAKIQPWETTEAAAKRHLERHHLLLWEGGSGVICVGMPDDQQVPLYRHEQRRGYCTFLDARPVRDWSDAVTELHVYQGAGSKIHGVARSRSVERVAAEAGHFRRIVNLQNQGIKDAERARLQARRELAARSRRKAAWEIRTSDWGQPYGGVMTPYAIGTTCDVDVSMHDGTDLRGVFLVTGVRKSYTVDESTAATLTLLQQGLINPNGS